MNELLDKFAPQWLGDSPHAFDSRPRVEMQIFADGAAEAGTLRVTYADPRGATWDGDVAVQQLLRLLDDIEEGIATQLDVGAGLVVSVEVDNDIIEVQMGPVVVQGTLDEWRRLVERELGDTTSEVEMGVRRAWLVEDVPVPNRVAVLECE